MEQSDIENFLGVGRDLQVSGLSVEKQRDFVEKQKDFVEKQRDFEEIVDEEMYQGQSLVDHQEGEEFSFCEDELQKAHQDAAFKRKDNFQSPQDKCEFKCDSCGEIKTSELNLKVHIKMKHKVGESKENIPGKKVSSIGP